MAALLDSSLSYTREATRQLPQTTDLITNSRTVLETQRDQSNNILGLSRDVRLLADQLKKSDPDYRRVIAAGPDVAEQVSGLLRESGPGPGVLVSNLLTTAEVYRARLNSVEETLVVYPTVLAGTRTVEPGDGTAHFGLVLNSFDPYVCVRGYEKTRQRHATDVSPLPANDQAQCAEPPDIPTDVRGAQNAPHPPGGR